MKIMKRNTYGNRREIQKKLVYALFLACSLCLFQLSGHQLSFDETRSLLALLNASRTSTSYTFSDVDQKNGNRNEPSLGVAKHQNNPNPIRSSRTPNDDKSTLGLLYPPGLLGGYRNQVIRFFSLVLHATQHNISQLLLPTLLWTTDIDIVTNLSREGDFQEAPSIAITRPIPMEELFDVEHWNSFSSHLPVLVDSIAAGDCWSPQANDQLEAKESFLTGAGTRLLKILSESRFVTPLRNESSLFARGKLDINPRRVDYYPKVEHCTRPRVYGGGGGRGRLWVDYMQYQKQQLMMTANGDNMEDCGMECRFLQALRPKKEWRQLAMQCVRNRGGITRSYQREKASYVALHPRVELEMLVHPCGQNAMRNLTQIFEQLQDFLYEKQLRDYGIFVALSRSGIQLQKGEKKKRYLALKPYAEENIRTLNRVVADDRPAGLPLVFECGERLLDQYYHEHPSSVHYGSVLHSIINFYIAVESEIFVGFRYSSFSKNVWTTRYYQGKGSANYEYTKDNGIVSIPNGGLPPSHENCKHPVQRKA